ncbi:MAG TPA: TetR/AcrR family transcriptional regulator [Rhizomicrobium sp.]|jgi:AcrR family transcriptional regulator
MARKPWGEAVQNREEQFGVKRAAVLNTAARLIRRRGYENVSLGDIADELHIAKPTVYYYFKNKDEIVLELMAIALESFLNPHAHPGDYPLAPSLTGAQRLERFIRRGVRIVADDVGSSLVTTPSQFLENDTRLKFDVEGQPVREMGEKIIQGGVRDGSLAPCDVQATYLFLIGALRYLPVWYGGQTPDATVVADALVNLVLRGIAR